MQVVQGINATQSGVALLPLMGGLILSSTICGRLVTRTGRYKPFMIGGGIVLVIGVILLTQITADTTARDLAWRLAVTGIGLGPAQSLFSLVIQNAVPMTESSSIVISTSTTPSTGSPMASRWTSWFRSSQTGEVTRSVRPMPMLEPASTNSASVRSPPGGRTHPCVSASGFGSSTAAA